MKPHSTVPVDYAQYVEDVLREEDVHDLNTTDSATATNGLFIALALVLTLLHAFNLYLLLSVKLWPMIPIILHLAVSCVTTIVTYAQYRKGLDVQHLAILSIVSFMTGIFGTVGALFGYICFVILSQKRQSFKEWYESIFPTDNPTESQKIYDDILEGIDENPQYYGVMPFLDVMRLGSEDQKRRALAKMTSRFHPRLSPAFKAALKDPSNTIRVQAATAVAKIEKDFMRKLERIQEARMKEPKNPYLTMALAKFFDDYAFTGILDLELEKNNRMSAIETYKAFLQQDANNAEAWVAIGRLLYRNRQWEEASEWFRQAVDRGWNVKNMMLWHFECLFRLGHFRELRHTILEHGRGIVAQEDLPRDVRDAVNLWIQVA